MKVIIEAINAPELWQEGGLTATLRIEALKGFTTSDGQFVPPGNSANKFYLEIPFAITAKIALIPSFEIDSTEDCYPWDSGRIGDVPGYRATIKTSKGKIIPYFPQFRVPVLTQGDTSFTWGELRVFNRGFVRGFIADRLLKESDVQQWIQAAVGGLNKASETALGVTALSYDAVDPSYPIAVGDNDPRLVGLPITGGGGGAGAWPPPLSGMTTVAYSATPVFDAAAYSYFRMWLTGDVTSSSVNNPSVGKLITFEIIQSTSGGQTFVWPTDFADTPALDHTDPCGSPPTAILCPIEAVSRFSFYYGADNFWHLVADGGLAGVPSSQLLNPAVLAGNIVVANAFPGTNLSGQIARADAALGFKPGTIWVLGGGDFGAYMGATSPYDFDNLGYVVINEGHDLFLGPGDYTGTGDQYVGMILPRSNCRVYGAGPATRLHAPSGWNANNIITPYLSSLDNGNTSENIVLSDFQVVGQEPQVITDLVVNSASYTATSATAGFTYADNGKTLRIPAYPNYAAVVTFVDATHITLSVLPPTTGTVTANKVLFSSATPHIYLGNGKNCSVRNILFTRATSIAVAAGGNSSLGNHSYNVTIENNLFVECVSQNAALVNSANSTIRNNLFLNPSQAHGPGVSVIDLETNAVDDVIIGNAVEDNIIFAMDSVQSLNTGIAFTNGNLSKNGGNRIINNQIWGQDPTVTGTASNLSNGIVVRGGNIQDCEVSDNMIFRASLNGIEIEDGMRVRVSDNVLTGCGSAGSGSAITLTRTAQSVIEDNICRRALEMSVSDTSHISATDDEYNIYRGNMCDGIYLTNSTGSKTYNNLTAGDSLSMPHGAVWEDLPQTVTGATPTVGTFTFLVFGNGGATTVTNLLGAAKGHQVTLQGDANTTIQNNANIVTRSGADITPFAGKTQTFRYNGTAWVQIN